jgi:hypothetical protein
MAKQRRIGDQFHAGSRDFSTAFRSRLGPTPASYTIASLSRRLGPTQPRIQWLPRIFLLVVEGPEREPHRSLPSVFGVNAWSCVFTSWLGS